MSPPETARPRLTAEWHHLSAAADAVHRARTLAHTAPGSDALDAEITDAIGHLHDARSAIHRHAKETPSA